MHIDCKQHRCQYQTCESVTITTKSAEHCAYFVWLHTLCILLITNYNSYWLKTWATSYFFTLNYHYQVPGYAQIPSLHSCHEEPNECFQVHVSPFLLHFPLLHPQRDGTVTSRLHVRSAAGSISPASYQNKMFYIFSSVFLLKLSLNWVYNTFLVFSQYCCVSLLFIVSIWTV